MWKNKRNRRDDKQWVEHCNVHKVKSTRVKVKGDKMKNEGVKWENVRRTLEIINRKEKDDAWTENIRNARRKRDNKW